MLGLAVAIMRNHAPESLMEVAFSKDVNINVPTAPEVGLFLDECFFCSYNKRWKSSHEEVSMKDYEKEAEEFKMKFIYPHVASMEHKEGAVALWLHSLNRRNYPDFHYVETNGKTVVKEEIKEESMGNEELKENNLAPKESKNLNAGAEELKEEKLGKEEMKEEKLDAEEMVEEILVEKEIKEEKLGAEEMEDKKLGVEEMEDKNLGDEEILLKGR